MKLRNQLIALACLLTFAMLGVFYVRMWVVQKPRQIILFVSDAMTSRSLAAARLYAGGADYRLALERFPNTALLRNFSAEYAVPDTSSAATAVSTGKRTRHRSVATTEKGLALETILERAKSTHAVGLVTNATLASPSVAAFYAHTTRPSESEGIALQLFEKDWVKVVLGGGVADFQPEDRGGRRKDGRDLVSEWEAKDVKVVRTKAELENTRLGDSGRLVGLFSSGPMAFSNQMESGSQQPSLADMTRRAINLLRSQRGGYVLVVDAALYTAACEGNQAEKALREVLALDEAVGVALKEAGDKALILAVGRHGTGGLTLSGYPLREQKRSDLLGLSPDGTPFLTWSTGPNGPQSGTAAVRNEPAAVAQPSALNSAEDVLGVGRGPGAERLSGFLDNTEIFSILRDAL
ncbi:MAG: alkaline phosphatase [Verrucomicrobiota bacterium]